MVKSFINQDFFTQRLHLFGALGLPLYIYLAWLSHETAAPPLMAFFFIMLSAAGLSLLAYRSIASQDNHLLGPLVHKQSPAAHTITTTLCVILFWGVIYRLLGLLGGPIFEDDFFRYLWDGYLFFERGSPYGVPPSDYFTQSDIAAPIQRLLDGINHPDVSTLYGPFFQYSFLLNHLLFPAEVFGLQLQYVILDIALLLVLYRLGAGYGLILYAWSPLVIKEIAFTAHPDGIGITLLMASLLACSLSHQKTTVFLLALAIAAKIFALLLAPFILWRCQRRYWLLFAMVLIAIYLPFIIFALNQQAASELQGLSVMANNWQFNASIFALLGQLFDEYTAKIICAGLFLVGYGSYWLYWQQHSKRGELPRGDWIFGFFFLLAPVVNAWYVMWLLAFAALFVSRWAWTTSIVVLLTYITGLTTGDPVLAAYQQPLWALIMEYTMIAMALALDIRASGKSLPGSPKHNLAVS